KVTLVWEESQVAGGRSPNRSSTYRLRAPGDEPILERWVPGLAGFGLPTRITASARCPRSLSAWWPGREPSLAVGSAAAVPAWPESPLRLTKMVEHRPQGSRNPRDPP